MSESELSKPVGLLLGQILEAWLHRDERKAATKAGSLGFWRDGMLKELKTIAEGKADKKTFASLRKQLKETKGPVSEVIEKLREARNQMGRSPVAEAIDGILSDEKYGKIPIRAAIETLLKNPNAPDTSEQAKDICGYIDWFNTRLRQLHQSVNG